MTIDQDFQISGWVLNRISLARHTHEAWVHTNSENAQHAAARKRLMREKRPFAQPGPHNDGVQCQATGTFLQHQFAGGLQDAVASSLGSLLEAGLRIGAAMGSGRGGNFVFARGGMVVLQKSLSHIQSRRYSRSHTTVRQDKANLPTVDELALNPERLKELRKQCKLDRPMLGDQLCNRVAEATRKRFYEDGDVPHTTPKEPPKF